MKTKSAGLILVILAILVACLPPQPAPGKVDAALLRMLDRPSAGAIHFSGECVRPITPKLRARIKSTGARIQTVVGTRFTALGRRKAVVRLSRMEFIRYLEGATRVYKR